jgi:hypothetical protein
MMRSVRRGAVTPTRTRVAACGETRNVQADEECQGPTRNGKSGCDRLGVALDGSMRRHAETPNRRGLERSDG